MGVGSCRVNQCEKGQCVLTLLEDIIYYIIMQVWNYSIINKANLLENYSSGQCHDNSLKDIKVFLKNY